MRKVLISVLFALLMGVLAGIFTFFGHFWTFLAAATVAIVVFLGILTFPEDKIK